MRGGTQSAKSRPRKARARKSDKKAGSRKPWGTRPATSCLRWWPERWTGAPAPPPSSGAGEGGEFLGIIGNTRPGILEEVGERFRALVARCSLDRRPDLRVTISVGGTYALADDTVASLADRMLYGAKAQGRDRVCVTGS